MPGRVWFSRPAAAAFAVYAVIAIVLFGQPLLHPGAHECVCIGSTTDAGVYVWAFRWWPHALLHGLNPFFTHLLYAPQGINLAHGTLVPGAALIFAPVTAIAGPLFSFNLAMLLSPVLAAWFAFLLCHRLTRAFWPSLVGGWFFGFSSYVLGQLVGHLNLTLVFLVPAIVHLVLRVLAGELSRRWFVVLMTVALVVQFSFSVEVFAALTMFGAVALLFAYALSETGSRARLRAVLGPITVSYLAALVVVSPYLYYALKPGGAPVLHWRTDLFSSDLLGFVVPTQITAIGGSDFLSTSLSFTAGYVEGGTYLGLPLIAIALLSAFAARRSTAVKVMLATLAVVVVCSLGGHLHVGGATGIPLPWAAAERLPVLGLMLPARFILFGALICAVLTAMWLARARARVRVRVGAWVLAALAVLSLWPAIGRHYWRGAPGVPKLFTSAAFRRVISPKDTVLVLPVGIAGQSMLWNAEADLGFRMASGYVIGPEAPNPYKRFAIYPTLTYGARVPDQSAAASRFLAAEHVTVVALDARTAASSVWVPLLERLGWGPETRDGVVLLRHNGFIAAPVPPEPPPRRPLARGPSLAQVAARHVATEYFRALAATDPSRVCRLTTTPAIAAQLQRHDASQAICVRTLARLLPRATALRVSAGAAVVGPASLAGRFGYVAVAMPPGRQSQYLPLRLIRGRWQVDGVLVPARTGP